MIKQSGYFLTWRLFPTTYLSLLLFVLLFPVSLIAPTEWDRGNMILEYLQRIVLSIGIMVSWLAGHHSRSDRKARNLWLWVALGGLLVLIGREINWESMFLPVAAAVIKAGFSYDFLINAVTAAVIITVLIGLYFNFPIHYIRQAIIPLTDIVIFLLAIITAFACNKSPGYLAYSHEATLGLWSRLTATWSLTSIITIIGFRKRQRYTVGHVTKACIVRRVTNPDSR